MATSPHSLDLSQPFCIGRWTVFPHRHELSEGSQVVRVEPKVMALLLALARQAGKPVSRDALMATVWPEVVVSDDALNRAVSKLRHALGDTPQAPHYIETIPKRGYALIVGVTAYVPSPPVALPLPPQATSFPRWLGAVLLAVALAGVLGAVGLRLRSSAPQPYASEPLTRLAGTERFPALAPDGRLAFSGRTRGGAAYDLFVQPSGTATPVQLTSSADSDLFATWAPDGQSVVFLRCRVSACHPYRISAVGGPAARLSEHALAPYGLAHHTTEPLLLGVQRDSSTVPYRLHTLNLDTQALTPLTAPEADIVGDLFPALRADGTVAFVRHGTNGVETVRTALVDQPGRAQAWGHYPARLGGLTWMDDVLAHLHCAGFGIA